MNKFGNNFEKVFYDLSFLLEKAHEEGDLKIDPTLYPQNLLQT
jgi:hypothetical protein